MTEPLPLELGQDLRERLVEWSLAARPREACGLLIGGTARAAVAVSEVTHARNTELARPHERYTVHPEDHLAAERSARARGLAIVGVWHSHPASPAMPSATDLAGAAPGWTYLIVSLASPGAPSLRAFRLAGDEFVAQPLSPNVKLD